MAWKLRGASALLSIALAAGVASGQELSPDIQEGRALTERFQLFDRCRPMELLVESLPEAGSDIGLTRKAIRAAAGGAAVPAPVSAIIPSHLHG